MFCIVTGKAEKFPLLAIFKFVIPEQEKKLENKKRNFRTRKIIKEILTTEPPPYPMKVHVNFYGKLTTNGRKKHYPDERFGSAVNVFKRFLYMVVHYLVIPYTVAL